MLLVLAAIHFTAVVDFLVIMPLGPQYMRVLDITSARFGLMVSVYGISAGLAGILLGIFLGRMDRRSGSSWQRIWAGRCRSLRSPD